MFAFSKKTVLALASAILLTLGIASVSSAGQKLRVGYLVADQLHHPALMIMKQRHLLEDAGFDVTWNEFLAGSYVMQEMSSGTLDFAVCGVAPVAIAHAQGVKLNILASGNQEGSALIVSNEISSIKDLDGKKVGTPGTGTIQDAMVAQLAKDNGIRARRMSMKVSNMPLFLKKGEVAAFIAWEPHVARAAANGFGKILYTSREMMPGHQCCVLVAPAGKVQSAPETVKKVMEIYLQAYKWFFDHPEESIQMVMKATGISNHDIIKEAMTRCSYPARPYCNEKSIAEMVGGLIATRKITGITQEQVPAFTEELYNPAFVEELTGTKRP